MADNNSKGSSTLSTIDLLDYSASKRRRFSRPRRRGVDPARAERFAPDVETGLMSDQVTKRTEDGLVNAASRTVGRSYARIIFSNLFTYLNLLILVIFIAMMLVVDISKDWSKFLFVVIVSANTIIGIVLEIKSKMTIDRLKLVTAPTAIVVRDGATKAIPVREVVLDDIIYLESGKQICADSVIVRGECEVNESMLTGESVPVHKGPGDVILSGSFMTSGNCYARVDRIGDDNYVETLSSYAKKYKKPKSELNNAINLVIKVVSVIMIPIAILMIYRTYMNLVDTMPLDPWGRGSGHLFYEIITTVSGALIGMIPSGMFLLTSVALATSVIRLGKRHTLVQNIYCIEMLARVDVLCLDKTGTITDGSMIVKNVIPIKGADTGGFTVGDIIGSMLSATEDNNQTAIALADKIRYNLKFRPTTVLPFSSARKLSAVTFEGMGTYMLGAPEFVLSDMGVRIRKLVEDNASQGFRVMCLAHSPADIRGERLPAVRRPLCLIIIEDHIRGDAVDTIRWFKENDVAVKVISGDNPLTVSEVARRVGVQDADKYISLEGLSAHEVMEAANKYTVFGRVTPEQKSILVKSMKAKGHTVAMTGDGVNDILAMRQADCAVSIASGAEAARNVAHLVLMDNNFTSMPDVVVEGRRVINNIAKSSSLYLMKTMMTVLLSIAALALGTSYFFTTNMTLMYEIFITAIPSFFLALQTNKDRVRGRFLTNMLKNAFPGGITLSLAVMAVYVYWILAGTGEYGAQYNAEFLSMVTLTVTYAGYFLLVRLAQPYNAYRVVLVAFTFALCLFGTIVLGESTFGIDFDALTLTDWFFMSTVVLAAYGVVSVLFAAVNKINIATQPLEVEAAAEEQARLEEQKMLEELREQRRQAEAIDADEPEPPPVQKAK